MSSEQQSHPQSPTGAPYGQPAAGYPGYQQPPVGEGSDDRTWAAVSHALSFLSAWFALGIVCPIVVLIARPDRPFVRRHAYESLNFQLNALVLAAAAGLATVLTLGLALFVIIPLAVVYVPFYCIVVVLATMAANRGEEFRYPLTVRVFTP